MASAGWLLGLGQGLGNVQKSFEDFRAQAEAKKTADLQRSLMAIQAKAAQANLDDIPASRAMEDFKAGLSAYGPEWAVSQGGQGLAGTAGIGLPAGAPLPQAIQDLAANRADVASNRAFTHQQQQYQLAGDRMKQTFADFISNAMGQQPNGGLQQAQAPILGQPGAAPMTNLPVSNPSPSGMKAPPSTPGSGLPSWLTDAANPMGRMALKLGGINPDEIVGGVPQSPAAIAAETTAREKAQQPFVEEQRQWNLDHALLPVDGFDANGHPTKTFVTKKDAQGNTYAGKLPDADVQRMRALESARASMRMMEPLITSLNQEAGIAAKLKGTAQGVQAELNYNNKASLFKQLYDSTKINTARAMGANGRVTAQEINAVGSSYPQLGQSDDLTRQSIDQFYKLLDSMEGPGFKSGPGVINLGQQPGAQPPATGATIMQFDAQGNLITK